MYYVQIVFIIHKCILLLNAFFFFFHQMQYILWQYPPAMFYKITVQWSFATIIVLEQTSNQSWSLNSWSKAISQRNYFSRVFFFLSLYTSSLDSGKVQNKIDSEMQRLGDSEGWVRQTVSHAVSTVGTWDAELSISRALLLLENNGSQFHLTVDRRPQVECWEATAVSRKVMTGWSARLLAVFPWRNFLRSVCSFLVTRVRGERYKRVTVSVQLKWFDLLL